MANITQILEAVQQGDPRAGAGLFPLVYEDLSVRQGLAFSGGEEELIPGS